MDTATIPMGLDAAPRDAAAPQAASSRRLPLAFVGSGSEYFRIWIVNLLLTLVTLGLYYPFAKVRRLKYFHGATELAGAPFGFHADPWKMLRGYLLVGVMVGLYTVAGQFSPMAGFVAFVIVALVWPALWWSSLRFRLAYTSWRALRFHFRGTMKGAYQALAAPFAVSAVLLLMTALAFRGEGVEPDEAMSMWTLLPLLVALVAAPLFWWLMKRYQHGHFALGDEHAAFEARLASFYKVMLVAAVLMAVVLALVLAPVFLALRATAGPDGGDEGGGGLLALLPVLMVFGLYLLVIAVVGGYFTARMQNLCWNKTASPHIAFDSALRARSLIGLWLKNSVLVVCTLGLYWPFAMVASARLRLQAVHVVLSTDLDTLSARLAAHHESAAGDAAGDLLGLDIGL